MSWGLGGFTSLWSFICGVGSQLSASLASGPPAHPPSVTAASSAPGRILGVNTGRTAWDVSRYNVARANPTLSQQSRFVRQVT